jgi:hypothetical protein
MLSVFKRKKKKTESVDDAEASATADAECKGLEETNVRGDRSIDHSSND